MRDYLVSFAMTSLLVALASVLSPDGKIKRSVSLALSVNLISALMLPLFRTLKSLLYSTRRMGTVSPNDYMVSIQSKGSRLFS